MPGETLTVDRDARGWQRLLILCLLIAFFLYCDSFLNHMSMPVGDSQSGFHIFLVWIGMFIAQPALLAVWAVFGSEPRMVRIPKTLFLACLVSLALTYGTWLNQDGRLDASEYTSTLMPITQFLAAVIVLWVFKVFSSWQIVGPAHKVAANRASAEIGSDTQFSLRQLLIWQSLTALVIVLASLLFRESDLQQDLAGLWPALRESSVLGLGYGLFSLLVVFHLGIVLGIYHRIRLTLAAIITNFFVYCVIIGIMAAVAGSISENDVLRLLIVFGSFHATMLLSLLMVRVLGFRLMNATQTVEPQLPNPPTTARALLIAAVIFVLTLATIPLARQLHIDRQAHHQELAKYRLGIGISTRGDGSAQVNFFPNQVVKDEAIEYALDWPEVSCLVFTSTGISDEQLERVSKIKHVKTLFLDSTRITDEGLQHLESLENLTALYLTNSAVTVEGVEELKTALPGCVIIFEPITP